MHAKPLAEGTCLTDVHEVNFQVKNKKYGGLQLHKAGDMICDNIAIAIPLKVRTKKP